MSDTPKEHLGRLISVHPLAPAYVQRAVFIAILSFLFFLAMMLAYYLSQSPVYFLLASAFLVVYLITMLGWLVQRRNVVNLHENGLAINKQVLMWPHIQSFRRGRDGGLELTNTAGKTTRIPTSVFGIETIAGYIKTRVHLPD